MNLQLTRDQLGSPCLSATQGQLRGSRWELESPGGSLTHMSGGDTSAGLSVTAPWRVLSRKLGLSHSWVTGSKLACVWGESQVELYKSDDLTEEVIQQHLLLTLFIRSVSLMSATFQRR